MAFDKVIRIFIGSSIEEFKYERAELDSYISDLSERYFEEKYNVRVKAERCEKVDPAVSAYESKQHEYNEEMIGKSDICIFLFFTRAGEFTQQEFADAVRRFKESNGDKPKVYVYFKVVPEGVTVDHSIDEFKEVIDKAFGHYFGCYEHLDTIKLRILLSLKMQEEGFCAVEYKDGGLQVNGQQFLSIDLTKVNEFEHNEGLKEMQEELAQVEEEYYQLKPNNNAMAVTADAYRRYATVAAKRQRLMDSIEELKGNIFKLSMRISSDAAHGDVTPRMKEAYRLLDLGDTKGCLEVLDGKERKAEYLRRKEQRLAEAKMDATYYIREGLLEISVLETLTDYAGRFERIREIFEDILPEVMEYQVEPDAIVQCVVYLNGQKDYARAIEVAEEAIEWMQDAEGIGDEYARTCLALAAVLVLVQRYADAEKLYDAAIASMEKLPKTYANFFSLTACYADKGALYLNTLRLEKAELLLAQAYTMSQKLPDTQDVYLLRLGIGINLGLVNLKMCKTQRAAAVLANSMKNADKAERTDIIEHYRAMNIRTFGMVCFLDGNNKTAETCMNNAKIIWSYLARKNPVAYEGELAQVDYMCAEMYYEKDENQLALQKCDAAIAVYKRACLASPEAFEPYLAVAYRLKGDLTDDLKEAIVYYQNAATILERYLPNNDTFGEELLLVYCAMMERYDAEVKIEEETACIDKIFETYERMPKSHTFAVDGCYAMACLRKAENDHVFACDYESAYVYFQRAIVGFEPLVNFNLARYELLLMAAYTGIIELAEDMADEEDVLDPKKKEELHAYAKKGLALAEKLRAKDEMYEEAVDIMQDFLETYYDE